MPCAAASEASPPSLSDLDTHLGRFSYLLEFVPTQYDLQIHAKLQSSDLKPFPNLKRWFYHISTFTSEERKNFSNASTSMNCQSTDITSELKLIDQRVRGFGLSFFSHQIDYHPHPSHLKVHNQCGRITFYSMSFVLLQ